MRIWVHLGCTDQEKYHPQLVSFNIDLTFRSPPKGLTTDNIDDTVCYLETVNNIQNLCSSKQFNIIEHLIAEVYKTIELALSDKKDISLINVVMHKLAPPVPGVHGGISFTYCDAPLSGCTKS